jgi:hypothetical protein
MKMLPLFSEGSRASRIVRLFLYAGWMAGGLVAFSGIGGHTLRHASMVVGLICLIACFVEHWRVHRTGGEKIEPLNLRGPSR